MKILWICRNLVAASERSEMLHNSRKRKLEDDVHMIIWPGMGIQGRGFDEIILDDFDPYNPLISSVERVIIAEWFDCSIRCRLFPGGKIRILKDFSSTLE